MISKVIKRGLGGVMGLVFTMGLHAQYYSINTDTGQDPYMFYFRGLAAHTFTAPKENVLSSWINLPFTWDFFDSPVRGYYISDNGYITFDSLSTASFSQKAHPGDTQAPANSIFAFWTDLHLESGYSLWSNEVATATIGTAPDRVHVIYWMRVVPAGMTYSTANISFAIALYEEGGFDVVYTVNGLTSQLTGSVGAKSPEGNSHVNAVSSPSYIFPSCGYGDADDVCLKFRKNVSLISELPAYADHYFVSSSNNNVISIQSNNPADRIFQIAVYTMSGERIYSANIQGSVNTSIDLNGHKAGMYLVLLNTEKGKRILKILH